MSYRRKNEETAELRRYKTFCQDNIELIRRIGLPSIIVENHDTFIYFLMHGALWPNAPVRFNIDNLDEEKGKAYLLLLDRYFETGLTDPGLSGLSKAEMDELERKHPKQFEWRAKWREKYQTESD